MQRSLEYENLNQPKETKREREREEWKSYSIDGRKERKKEF
jgi:hypothetical protein